ncbi:LysR substrate-binding domain-containing protein [Actinomadura keratinilytica]
MRQLQEDAVRFANSWNRVRRFRLGATHGPLLGALVDRLAAAEPAAPVSTHTSWSVDEISSLLAAGRLDHALIGVCGESTPPRDTELVWQSVGVDPVFVMLPEGHPLAEEDEIPLARLSHEAWTDVPGDGCFADCFTAACARAGFTPLSVFETDTASCVHLVQVGRAVGLCRATFPPTPGLVTRPLAGAPLSWRHLLGHHPGSPAAGAAAAVLGHARAAYREAAHRSDSYRAWLDGHPRFGAPPDPRRPSHRRVRSPTAPAVPGPPPRTHRTTGRGGRPGHGRDPHAGPRRHRLAARHRQPLAETARRRRPAHRPGGVPPPPRRRPGPETHPAVEAEARRALHVHALLEARTRQAAETAVLNDLARRLAALHAPQDVLDEVAAQARRLLGTDLSYIMLAQDDAALRIEVVDGSIGSALRGVELARGVGLGGLVVRTGQPHWCADYRHDDHLTHAATVDAAAAVEQLRGILGVPLRLGEETIGVLLVAQRVPRTWTDHQTTLLTALAAHAALALHNAELFDRHQRTTAELRRRAEADRRAVTLHQRLTHIVLGGAAPRRHRRAPRGPRRRITVLDAHDTALATGATDPAPDTLATALAADTGPPAACFTGPADRATRLRDTPDGHWALAPVVVADEYAGCVVARRHQPFDANTVRSLETGATVIGLVLASERAATEAERRVRGEYLTALLDGTTDDAVLLRRARSGGIDPAAVRTVLVLDGPQAG